MQLVTKYTQCMIFVKNNVFDVCIECITLRKYNRVILIGNTTNDPSYI